MATKTVTPNQPQSRLDWNLPRRPRTPKGEYHYFRKLMVIPSISNPSSSGSAVCQ